MRHRWTASFVAAVLLVLLSGLSRAAEKKKPDATLKLTEGSVAVGIGWNWGKGELHYKGKTYKFKVEGLSLGELGQKKASAVGEVYNLKKLEDFDGLYAAGGAAATAGEGKGVAALQNPNGVSVLLKSTTQGLDLKAAAEGIKLTLEK